MTIQSATYPVTIGSNFMPEPLTLTPPNNSGSTVWKWVVVSNLTGFLASIANVADDPVNVPYLQPFTGDKYQYTNVRGAMQVSWIAEASAPTSDPTNPPYITVQFSDVADGSDFPDTYPISYTAQAVQAAIFTDAVTILGQPIEEYTVGGTLRAIASAIPGGPIELIPASPGQCIRLQRIVYVIETSTGTGIVRINGLSSGISFSVFNIADECLNDNCEGVLSEVGEQITWINGGDVDVAIAAFYDYVTPPSI